MVSAQISGTLRFYRIDTNGSKTFLFGGNIAYLGPSGSSEGVIASTPEKWGFIPLLNSQDKLLRVNEKMEATFTPIAAATIGTGTKSKAVIPITYQNGTSDIIGDFASSVEWDDKQLATKAIIAGDETIVARKTVRIPFALGSNTNKVFASIENSA